VQSLPSRAQSSWHTFRTPSKLASPPLGRGALTDSKSDPFLRPIHGGGAKVAYASSARQGPEGDEPICAELGSVTRLLNVTSTTLLGVPSNFGASTKVFGPRGLLSPYEHRGDPELYLHSSGSTFWFASNKSRDGPRTITSRSLSYRSKWRMPYEMGPKLVPAGAPQACCRKSADPSFARISRAWRTRKRQLVLGGSQEDRCAAD
jgi:hypothetical protein